MTKIGVFDSGIGGLSVARAIEKALPNDTVIFACDKQHMPYGDKSPQEVLGFVVPILEHLAAEGCQVIVIACNTVTTTLIEELRHRISVPLVGIEPMVKTAAEQTKSGIIAVCATPATLKSSRYAWLKETYAPGLRVLEPDCSTWAYMVEHDQIKEQQLRQQIDEVCSQGADVIVLGCTHYHWIRGVIQEMAGQKVAVIQPEQAVIKRLKQVLGRG
ncbi:MAG TPA: glutamate racemase [Patescibacteria group bacterium]|nr:glutamate racemase [Patescibacteria group bacterium]